MNFAMDPEKIAAVQNQCIAAWAQLLQDPKTLVPKDRRFKDAAWNHEPMAAWTAAMYSIYSNALLGLADAVQTDEKTKARIRFATEQWVSACAPNNFLAANPVAIQAAIETQGKSLMQGMHQLFDDIQRGHIQQSDENAFEVGRSLANTSGAVVFENEIFQLIQYQANTEKVHATPILIVPPCINKFYILDLQPHNSMVRYLVDSGYTIFMISWRSADDSLAHHTWEDYVKRAVIEAIDKVAYITKVEAIHTVGFCIGGTLLSCAAAVLAAKRRTTPIASMSLLTTLLDCTDTGVLGLFVDESTVAWRERQFAEGGVLNGRELALTFNMLRPDDLIWHYVVGRYLEGNLPRPFDLLYWNADSVNLPGPFYAWYLRHTYLQNELIKPGALKVCGVPLDLKKVTVPLYVYASREDHIVPAASAYASVAHLGSHTKRFVLGSSGHIAGVVNPPSATNRMYWTHAKYPRSLIQWQLAATEHSGSWWPDWLGWLEHLDPKLKKAPATYGRKPYAAIEPAPGRYVKAR